MSPLKISACARIIISYGFLGVTRSKNCVKEIGLELWLPNRQAFKSDLKFNYFYISGFQIFRFSGFGF